MYAFCLSCPSATLQCSPVRRHCTTSMDSCKGPTPQFPFRLKCLPSNKKRSQASGSAFFTVKTSLTIISPRTLLRRSVVPCMSTRVHWHHCWRGSPTCENGGDVCCGVTPLSILWACLHLALSHLLRYHCQNRATTGLLARVFFLKCTMTSTLSIFYIANDSPKSHMHWSNYWHSVTGPEHGKWHQNVPPTLSPSQPFLARHATPFLFPWKKHYVMR